jgi:farnesyl-diphosphate farnesyltransferase
VEDALAVLAALTTDDQRRIREVLSTITSGQEMDLRRFGNATKPPEGGSPTVIALQTDTELDDYTYRVAGCVGEFWTKMCRAHLFPEASLDDGVLLANGVRFGKGLQLVNILRDLAADLRRGCCYLPGERLSALGLAPLDLLEPANEPRLRPLYDGYLDLSASHLAAGWVYTNSLPQGQVRVRLACAWPILIGVRTLAKLRAGAVLDPAKPVKITRAEVRWILVRSVMAYPWPGIWRRLLAKAAG